MAKSSKVIPSCTLRLGESLDVLRGLPDCSFDAIVTDPPYSSGGMTAASRSKSTGIKYVQKGTKLKRPDFDGDQRDQRSWLHWCSLWMGEAYRVARPGAYFLTFTDWRQLAQATDALQCGGWIFRGIVPWDKTEGSRAPHTGYFRYQCEYVVWGTSALAGPSRAAPGPVATAIRSGNPTSITRPASRPISWPRCFGASGRVGGSWTRSAAAGRRWSPRPSSAWPATGSSDRPNTTRSPSATPALPGMRLEVIGAALPIGDIA